MPFKSSEDSINFAVRRMFHEVHKREPTPDEQRHLTEKWRKGGFGDLVLAEVYDSPEAERRRADAANYVARLAHHQILRREPSPEGLQARGGQVRAGHLDTMLAEIYDSQEAENRRISEARYPVRMAYQQILGREPEPDAIKAREHQVRAGLVDVMLAEVYDSPEAENRRVDEARFEVRKLLRAYLYRDTKDDAELDKWAKMWRSKGRDATLKALLGSREGKACTAAARKSLGLPGV